MTRTDERNATCAKDGGNPKTPRGYRFFQRVGVVGHTDEVNTTNRVTLFWAVRKW